jgi:hypothetical protein
LQRGKDALDKGPDRAVSPCPLFRRVKRLISVMPFRALTH